MTDSYFNGVRKTWKPLYEQLHHIVYSRLGTFEEHLTSSSVVWKHSTSFASISAKKDCMVISLPSDKIGRAHV